MWWLRVALVTVLAVGRRVESESTSTAAASYRHRTFLLRVQDLQRVFTNAEEEEDRVTGQDGSPGGDMLSPIAAETVVDVGEFAGYMWSLWLTATTRESHIVASLYAYPLETAQPKSTAVRFTVNVHGASGEGPGPGRTHASAAKGRSKSREGGSMVTAGSEVVRVSPTLEGTLQGVEATARLRTYAALEALGAFAEDGSAELTVTMEAWTSLEEAPNARRVRVHLQRVPPTSNAFVGWEGGGGRIRSGGYSVGELSRRRQLAAVDAEAWTPAGSPVPSWAPDTVAVLSLLETDSVHLVCQLMAERLGEDVVPLAAEAPAWKRFAFGQVGPMGLMTTRESDPDPEDGQDQDDEVEGLNDGRGRNTLFLEGVDFVAGETEATMILLDQGAPRALASSYVSKTFDALLPSADAQGNDLPPFCDAIAFSGIPGTKIGALPLAQPTKGRRKSGGGRGGEGGDSGGNSGSGSGSGGSEISIHMCRSESGGVSFMAYASPLSVLDLFVRVTLLHRWETRRHLVVQGLMTVPPWGDSWSASAPTVMQVVQLELDLEEGFVRPRARGTGGDNSDAEGKGRKWAKGRDKGGRARSAGYLQLQVEAAVLRPRRVALLVPFEAWNTFRDVKGPAQEGQAWAGDGDDGVDGDVHADWYARAASPSAHHWIEVQPWETVHQSISRHAAALASVVAGRKVGLEEIVLASEGALLPRSTWSSTTTSLYSALLRGVGGSTPEAANASAVWRWGLSDRSTVHVLPRPAVSDPRLSRECAESPPSGPTGAVGRARKADPPAPVAAPAVSEAGQEAHLSCELRDLGWYLRMFRTYGGGRDGGDDGFSWDAMMAMIDDGIAEGNGASHLLRDYDFLGQHGDADGGGSDGRAAFENDENKYSDFGAEFDGFMLDADIILPSSSETATELLLIAAASVYVTMTGWYCAEALRRLRTSGHSRNGITDRQHRRLTGGGGAGGGPKGVHGRGGGGGSLGGTSLETSRGGLGRGDGGGGGGGSVSAKVQVAIAVAFAPVQAAWFLIGIPCDTFAYLSCCAAAAVGVLLRCATLAAGVGAGPDDANAVAAAINSIGGGADSKSRHSTTGGAAAASGKKGYAKGGGAKGGGPKASTSGSSSGGERSGRTSAAATVATATAAGSSRQESPVGARGMAPATVSDEELWEQQAREEAALVGERAREEEEFEAQRLHAEARMRERRQTEWEVELRSKGCKAAAVASKAATAGSGSSDSAAKAYSTTQAKAAARAPPPAQQPSSMLPLTTMTFIPTPLHGNGTMTRRTTAAAALNPLLATTAAGVALPKARPLSAALADGMRQRVASEPTYQAQQQQHPPPLPPPRPPQPQLQSHPPLPQQPPPPRQPKAGTGVPPLPPQPPPANQPKRPLQPTSTWGPKQPLFPSGHPPYIAGTGAFLDGPPLSPSGSSQSAPWSESDMLGGDHVSIPWSDAGAEMHEQESLLASVLEGLTSPDVDRPELELALADDADTSSTTSSMARFQSAPISPMRPPMGDAAAGVGASAGAGIGRLSAGMGMSAATVFGGGMWGAGGGGGLAGGSFSLWGASIDGVGSSRGDGTRTSLW